jgi:hypothetical protein
VLAIAAGSERQRIGWTLGATGESTATPSSGRAGVSYRSDHSLHGPSARPPAVVVIAARRACRGWRRGAVPVVERPLALERAGQRSDAASSYLRKREEEGHEMTQLFYAYAVQDARQRDELESHLGELKQRGVLAGWHGRAVGPAARQHASVSPQLEQADVVLLLLSSDFVASDYCHGPEVRRAVERHRRGQARLIPVLLRPCDWKSTPFGALPALPRDGRPVTKWSKTDAAFRAILAGIEASPTGAASANGAAARATGAAAINPAPAGAAAPAPAQPTTGAPAAARAGEAGSAASDPAAATALPTPAQVALQPSDLGPEFKPLESPSAGADGDSRFMSIAGAGTRRVQQLVRRTESAGEAVARMESGARAQVAKGAVEEPPPPGVAPSRAVRRGTGGGRAPTSSTVFAAKGRFFVAAQVIDGPAAQPPGDAGAVAATVVQRMLERIPG